MMMKDFFIRLKWKKCGFCRQRKPDVSYKGSFTGESACERCDMKEEQNNVKIIEKIRRFRAHVE